jgi:signal transduction histidine kinase
VNSLAAKLSLAFITVVVLGVACVSLLVRIETTQGFESYLQAQGSNYLVRAADSLSELYQRSGGWQEAQPLVTGLLRSLGDRLVLADATGRIVADSAGQLNGQSAEGLDALNQAPIVVGSGRVGTLYLLSFSSPGAPAGRGPAMARGQGAMAATNRNGAAQPAASTLESGYLASVDRAILTAALLSGLLAIAVGLVVARRITRPLSELAGAAQELASGKLDHRVKVASGDELGRVAASFNGMAERLQRNEEARRHMAADIAHELRTPLAVVQGTVDGMLDGVIEPDQESLASIKEEINLLTKLVADLRTLSLAEAGRLKLDLAEVDLLEFTRRTVARVEPLARQKGVSCRVEGETPGLMVKIDAERMQQVVGNLLDNALRYTPEGGSITVTVGQGQGGTAVLSVADTGRGIPAEDLPHVFDRFYRADPSRSRKSGGSGLGLAIVKQLVEAHDGRVRVESMSDVGTRFTIELPLVLTAPTPHAT